MDKNTVMGNSIGVAGNRHCYARKTGQVIIATDMGNVGRCILLYLSYSCAVFAFCLFGVYSLATACRSSPRSARADCIAIKRTGRVRVLPAGRETFAIMDAATIAITFIA